MNRATAATVAVMISVSGTGPLQRQRGERNDAPGLERVLRLLRAPVGAGVASLSRAPDLAATHPGLPRYEAGVLHQQVGPSRHRGNVALNASYGLLFGGLAIAIAGFAEDPHNTRKFLVGFALIGGAFVVSCSTGDC